MKKIISLIISSKATLVLLVLFTIAIATATFVEDRYDTITAKLLIYNAKWFEFLLFLLVVNFIGSIKRYHLYRLKRLPGLLFHSAFIIVIIGAGITRYIGTEGSMHIREGSSSNIMLSSDTYLVINAKENNLNYKVERPLIFGDISNNYFNVNIKTEENSTIDITYKDYIKNAIEIYEEGEEGGIKILEITVRVDGHKDVLTIKDGELKETHGFLFAYNNYERDDALIFISNKGKILISYPRAIQTSKMPELIKQVIPKDSIGELKPMHLYEPTGTEIGFVLTKIYKNAKIKYTSGNEKTRGPDILLVDISVNDKKEEVPVLGGMGYVDNFKKVWLDGIEVQISYGLKKIELPFSIQLNKFILERYAGSDSPSSYASEVTLIDKSEGLSEDYRIYMNNVLDYKGYRFFQSSYDRDEKGTVLSVNHDFYGTWISYFGYLLMGLGFIATLFNKNSRYRELIHKIKNIRTKRKSLVTLLIFSFLSIGNINAQNDNTKHIHDVNQKSVSIEHSKKFGELLVQNYNGRFVPINTLAYDVMHKISRKDRFTIPTKGKMDAIQVFMDMLLNAEYWKTQSIIYVKEKSVINLIGLEGKYASFNDFFDQNGDYKLKAVAQSAFRKKPSEQNTFDKEIIKINERVEVFMLTFQGKILKIFPEQESVNNKWIDWLDPLANRPLEGALKILNDDLQLKEFNYRNLFRIYLIEVVNAAKSGDYTRANKILGYIDNIQRQSNSAQLLPSKSKVEKEIDYNNAKIFINLKNTYALLSIILLVLAFIDNLRIKKSKLLKYLLNFFIAILCIAFLYHTYGMGLRWYLSGHAPWSNGYEALILVSWASLLAGFSFMRYSKITLAATVLLAFFTLMTASHSSYDPQLTNLQPVLKSYWLIIHVATLTISYGFLGLGFVLGLMNMVLILVKNLKNGKRINLIIKELTHINEMNLTVGLFLATVGTFLGGIWANESWGRYWGWDAKETWALVIILTYTIVLHFRLVPKMKSLYIFNVGAIVGFSSVLMTFFGVNYYFTKGLHSYANGETPVFPIWAWVTILLILILIIAAGIKNSYHKEINVNKTKDNR